MPVTRRTRVVMLVDALADGIGGAERFAAALACALPSERFQTTLCTTRTMEPGRLVDELEQAGVSRLELGRRHSRDLLPLRRLGGFLRGQRVDVLHAHKFGSNLWGALIGRASGVPVVVAHEHTWSYEGNRPRKLIDGRVIAPLATRFVAVSELDRRRMIELEGVPAAKTVVVPTAYIPRGDDARTGDLRAELGIPAAAPVVGTLASMRPQKRLDLLLDAFRRVRARVPDAHLVLAGDGPELPRLRQRAATAELAGHVHFPGLREDLATVLHAFDVAAMSSDFEGMPLFVFEVMTHGVPLAATRVGGIPDVVEDGVHGRLVEPGDPAALGAALADLLLDGDARTRLAAAARERVAEFTLQRVADRFAALYDELLDGRAAAA